MTTHGLWLPIMGALGMPLALAKVCRYKYIYSPFFFRFFSRHNTNHRANGEATAHSNQAFGAFWSRVTPPELLYIWLLSFDELRLAMNAQLPVVRLLLCYARQGGNPYAPKRTAAPHAAGGRLRGETRDPIPPKHNCAAATTRP